MIEGIRPYEEMTDEVARTSDVNIPWLMVLPSHWPVVRSRRLFSPRTERARPEDQQLSATQAYGVIPQAEFERRVGRKVVRITQHLDKRAHVEPNDFVISMRSFQGGLERAWTRGCIRSSYVVLKPAPEVHVGYFAHLFKCQNYIRALQATSNFIRDGQDLNLHNFNLVDLPLPPFDEQADISRFLDHLNRKIERFIRAKRKLISLLNEQKQAIIHRAVTRGLNADALLKSSGIPWLGDIPKHWKVRKMKSLVRIYGGMTPSKGEARFWTGNIPWVSPKDMKVREIFDSEDHISRAAVESTRLSLIRPPAVLIVVRGMILARRLPVAVTRVPVTVNQDMKALVPGPDLNPEYFVSLLSGIQTDLLSLVEIAGHGTCCLRTDVWGSFLLPVPPLEEQDGIEAHLKNRLSAQDTSIARIQREIELMQEFRTRLVTDVVTGQLDVRAAATRLPEIASEDLSAGETPADDEESNTGEA
jgi:type I restriction enzyme, S subunit